MEEKMVCVCGLEFLPENILNFRFSAFNEKENLSSHFQQKSFSAKPQISSE